jgi:hypothetical protein
MVQSRWEKREKERKEKGIVGIGRSSNSSSGITVVSDS